MPMLLFLFCNISPMIDIFTFNGDALSPHAARANEIHGLKQFLKHQEQATACHINIPVYDEVRFIFSYATCIKIFCVNFNYNLENA